MVVNVDNVEENVLEPDSDRDDRAKRTASKDADSHQLSSKTGTRKLVAKA